MFNVEEERVSKKERDMLLIALLHSCTGKGKLKRLNEEEGIEGGIYCLCFYWNLLKEY